MMHATAGRPAMNGALAFLLFIRLVAVFPVRQAGAINATRSGGPYPTTFHTAPLSSALGMEVTLIDGSPPNLGEVWDRPDVRQTVETLLLDHKVLLFRGQAITPEIQLAIAQTFGPVTPHPLGSREDALASSGIPEGIVVLENTKGRNNEARNDMWHSDVSAVERPAAVNVLYAADYDLPSGIGDTLFANMERAYESLSSARQEALKEMDSYFSTHRFDNENPREKLKVSIGTFHPTVRTHPISCRDSLFISPTFFEHFRGLSESDSTSLLAELTALSTTPENTYRHRWTERDLIIFDNRNTMHYALYDYQAGINRTMLSARVQMLERPFSKHRRGGAGAGGGACARVRVDGLASGGASLCATNTSCGTQAAMY